MDQKLILDYLQFYKTNFKITYKNKVNYFLKISQNNCHQKKQQNEKIIDIF